MKQIKDLLKQKYELRIEATKENIYAVNDTVICLVVAPHSGTNNRWMVRFSTVAAFDRWANSCAIEEFFDTKETVIQYLMEKQIDIYKQLLIYLSLEYDEFCTYCNEEDRT